QDPFERQTLGQSQFSFGLMHFLLQGLEVGLNYFYSPFLSPPYYVLWLVFQSLITKNLWKQRKFQTKKPTRIGRANETLQCMCHIFRYNIFIKFFGSQ